MHFTKMEQYGHEKASVQYFPYGFWVAFLLVLFAKEIIS